MIKTKSKLEKRFHASCRGESKRIISFFLFSCYKIKRALLRPRCCVVVGKVPQKPYGSCLRKERLMQYALQYNDDDEKDEEAFSRMYVPIFTCRSV
jgi:hypothetical protein